MKNKVPKLICNITGVARVTTREYLDKKLADTGLSETSYLDLYVCKGAMKLLRQGMSVPDIRAKLNSSAKAPILPEDLEKMKKVNGKQGGAASGPAISPREARFQQQQEALAKKPAATVADKKVAAPATK